jgi:cyclopropane fatty-acyl-phospholipid synthase-like methyltransferase
MNGNVLQFDTIISTECFEHDMYWKETLNNIVSNLLKNDGLFVFTCATTGRLEHGTKKMNEGCSPLTCAFEEWENYYKNLTEHDIRSAIDMSVFSSFEFSENSYSQDLYFWGVKNK